MDTRIETAALEAVENDLSREGVLRFSVAHFLVTLVLTLASAPFIQSLSHGRQIETVLFTVMLLMAVLAVGGRRRALAFAILLATPTILWRWVHHYRPDLAPPEAVAAASLLFVAFVVFQFMRYILRAPQVNSEVLCAGISVYLLLGILWAVAYSLVWRADPRAFVFTINAAGDNTIDGFTSLYFSFITLSTAGYGDIIPVSGAARMLAMTEAMTGILFLTVLIARLVALYSAKAS